MKKRLRKKKRLGEFDQIGFGLEVTFIVADSDYDILYDAFIDFIESLNLCCGGGLGKHWCQHVNSEDDSSVTEENRQKVVEWLMKTGGTKIKTVYEWSWQCRPLTKSELNKFNLPHS